MNLLEAIRVALTSLRANKLRAALTTLGVIIGVGSVIAMIAIGRGASADIEDRIRSMGSNLLTVWPGQARQGRVFGGVGSQDTLRLTDADAILHKCTTVTAVAPQVSGSAQVKWSNQNANTSVIGATPEYAVVNATPADRGRYFNQNEVRGARPVCLVGVTLAKNVFGKTDPIGQRLRIKNIPFDVIGVLKEKGGGGSWHDPDDVVVVPISVAMRRLFGMDYVNRIYVAAQNAGVLSEAQQEITRLLRHRHRIRPGKDDDFNVRTQTEVLETFTATSQTFTMLLASIAAVSLLVGGIGVMNIMLVSVTERTREIGIRKAVGAKRRDILIQFLIESPTLCLTGGGDRGGPRRRHRLRALQVGGLANHRHRTLDPARLQLLGGRRRRLRPLPRPHGRQPSPHRSPPLRMRPGMEAPSPSVNERHNAKLPWVPAREQAASPVHLRRVRRAIAVVELYGEPQLRAQSACHAHLGQRNP
jgi:putative ABC transport system permease protein